LSLAFGSAIFTVSTSNRYLGTVIGAATDTFADGQSASVVYGNSGNWVGGFSSLIPRRQYYYDITNVLTSSIANNVLDFSSDSNICT
jgi:hypothetical protein